MIMRFPLISEQDKVLPDELNSTPLGDLPTIKTTGHIILYISLVA